MCPISPSSTTLDQPLNSYAFHCSSSKQLLSVIQCKHAMNSFGPSTLLHHRFCKNLVVPEAVSSSTSQTTHPNKAYFHSFTPSFSWFQHSCTTSASVKGGGEELCGQVLPCCHVCVHLCQQHPRDPNMAILPSTSQPWGSSSDQQLKWLAKGSLRV
jgi:hypothetical protein